MAFGYTKNEFEKKSTRERYRIERAELYFRRKAGATPFIFFAGALILGLYAYWGGGPLHYVSAALFAGLGVWQFFYVNRACVTAEEVDERVKMLWEETDLETDALNRSDMEYDAFINAPKILLYGYTKLPIGEKEALLRADSVDKAGRSSHILRTNSHRNSLLSTSSTRIISFAPSYGSSIAASGISFTADGTGFTNRRSS